MTERVSIERILIEVKDMKKFCIVLLLLSLTMGFLSGCTTMETPSQHSSRLAHVFQVDRSLMIDDAEYLLLIHKNSQLSPYHQRLGF